MVFLICVVHLCKELAGVTLLCLSQPRLDLLLPLLVLPPIVRIRDAVQQFDLTLSIRDALRVDVATTLLSRNKLGL